MLQALYLCVNKYNFLVLFKLQAANAQTKMDAPFKV